MNNNSLDVLFSGEKYLLLQGPMGPFFNDLAELLESAGRYSMSVVFNGGDYFYNRKRNFRCYYESSDNFSVWLQNLYYEFNYDTILCFGDCRALHKEAKFWAISQGIRFLVFEEGYLRPQFITLEEGGVNAFSSLPREANFYRKKFNIINPHTVNIKPLMWKRMWHAMWYYFMGWYYRHEYPHYRHHKTFSIRSEAFCWGRAYWRKVLYFIKDFNILSKLKGDLNQRYYLMLLQVYNDSQIRNHSHYHDVRDYINEVMLSFSCNARKDSILVIKHHPMDRGHRQYNSLITQLSKDYCIEGRVLYIHDLPMPELLRHTKGVVTINSTAGISTLIHNKPLKVMGEALYDIEGLTYQNSLDEFWNAKFKPDMELFNNFKQYLQWKTQINYVFYGRDKITHSKIIDMYMNMHR
ncbi:capsular biosynthesis protein [Escherichia coli]|nr:capsular biosynthesis protein [Escherichia coli]